MGKIVGLLSDSPASVRTMLVQEGSFTVDMRTRQVTKLRNMPVPFIEITMPCGQYRLFELKDIPKKSVPCPCGDPEHFFIEYKRSPAPPRINISQN
jgi:hypothetical protein